MSVSDELKEVFERMPDVFVPEKAAGIAATIQLNLSGEAGGNWLIQINDGQIGVKEGEDANADLTLGMLSSDYVAVSKGEVNPMSLFMAGKINIKGNMSLAMKFNDWFDRSRA